MGRRQFIVDAAFGASAVGSGAIWLPGCAAMQHAPTLPHAEVVSLIDRLERGIDGVRGSAFVTTARPWSIRDDAPARMLRLGLEALVVADVARSITPGVRLPDALATRLDAALPVLDECVLGYHALLDSAPPAVRRNLDARFAAEPDVAMNVAERIAERAASIGVSSESRLRMRAVASNLGTRVRRQSAGAVIDDSAHKIELAVGHTGADIRLVRGPATAAMISAIWQQVDGAAPSGGTASSPWGAAYAPGTTTPSQAYDPEGAELTLPEREPPGRGQHIVEIGGVLVGVGLGCFGIGGIISAALNSVWPIVIAATPGGICVLIGIIMLIVGAAMNG